MQDRLDERDDRLLTEILGDVKDGILTTDENGKIQYANDAAVQILGIAKDSRGKLFDEVCTIVDVTSGDKLASPVRQVLENRLSVGLKVNAGLIWPDGSRTYLSATATPIFDKDGNLKGCSAIFRDVTRLRRLELKLEENQHYLQMIFASATIGLCIIDAKGLIVDLNPAAEKLLGSSNHTALGRRFGDVINCENSIEAGCGKGKRCDYCLMNTHIQEAVQSAAPYSSNFVLTMQRADGGEKMWLNVHISTIYANERKNIIVSLIDISDGKRYEYELEQARAVAEEASTAKGQFLANMSHEIRTPITGMVGMIDLTLRTKLTEYQRGNLKSAKECSEYLLNIINDILDFSKLESGSLRLENLRFDLPKAVKETITSHNREAEAKGLFLKEQFTDDLPRYVTGDAVRIRQILNNLLNNAIKFTNAGGITVKVATGQRRGVKTLEFSVRDTGIGMVKSDLTKLFKPFSQVDGSATRRFGGTGLGLRITKELVDLMRGGVGVTSKAGEGSIFSFWIPCHEADGVDEFLRYKSVYVNPEPRRKPAPADVGEDVSDLMKYCLAELAKDNL